MILRNHYLEGEEIRTIYFGGGTPSLLDESELEYLLKTCHEEFTITPDAEITLEGNPEDFTSEKLNIYKKWGINRLSIGIQSFMDGDLAQLNRSHTATQSRSAIENAIQTGFENISIDLMFGLPNSTLSQWNNNLNIAVEYGVTHLSCYNLTVEERTALFYFVNKKKLSLPSEDIQKDQFMLTQSFLGSAGYDQYELSNYAKPGSESQHNRSYWSRTPYLGIGPSAHSFKGQSRSWNISNNMNYIKGIEDATPRIEEEVLIKTDVFNEIIMLGLRQKKGISRSDLSLFPQQHLDNFYESIDRLIGENLINQDDSSIFLTPENLYLSDFIASQLFVTEE